MYTSYSELDMAYLNLGKIQQFIDQGRLIIPEPTTVTINGIIKTIPYQLTMRDLYLAGLVSSIKDGIKILANVNYIIYICCY